MSSCRPISFLPREVTFLGPRLFWRTLSLCPSRIMFLVACFLCQLAVPFRLACEPQAEDRLALVIMLMTGPYFLFFCRSEFCTRPPKKAKKIFKNETTLVLKIRRKIHKNSVHSRQSVKKSILS